MGWVVQNLLLWRTGFAAPQYVGSSFCTQELNPISCIVGWILSHWTTREVPGIVYSWTSALNPGPSVALMGGAINWKAIMRMLGMYSWVVMFWNEWEMYASSVAPGSTSHEELGAGKGVCGPCSVVLVVPMMSIISEVRQGHGAHPHSQASQGTWQGRDRAKLWTHASASQSLDSYPPGLQTVEIPAFLHDHILTFLISLHKFESPVLMGKEIKRNPNWKRRSETVNVCRWHDTIRGKSYRRYQKTTRLYQWIQ